MTGCSIDGLLIVSEKLSIHVMPDLVRTVAFGSMDSGKHDRSAPAVGL
jgi:hypothetical protein